MTITRISKHKTSATTKAAQTGWVCLYRPCTYAIVKPTTGGFEVSCWLSPAWHIVVASIGARR
jgi:hypothetical protein